MPVTLRESEKKDIAVKVERTRGTGAISLTSPERRILDAARAVIAGFDWGAASWDGTTAELFALFDSTAAGLTAPATYYMQLRGVIGSERYAAEVRVDLIEWGP